MVNIFVKLFRYNWSQPDLAEIMNMSIEETEALWDEAAHYDIMLECRVFTEEVPCEDLLTPVITDGGM